MKIRCLAIDDEPLSLRIIEKYVAEFSNLTLVGKCTDAFQAIEMLKTRQVDFLLLDINMPKLSGIGLIRSLDNPPLVVFTTAYPEHAVEGFELEAVDYLLKPFSLERFAKAFNRVQERLAQAQKPTDGKQLLIKVDRKWIPVNLADILYLEAFGDYVKIFMKERMLLTKKRLAQIELVLPEDKFYKIHRSFIISLAAIDFIEGNMVGIYGKHLPISKTYREELLLRLG